MPHFSELQNNPQAWEKIFVKEYLIKGIRRFFERKGYHELESPILANMLPSERYLDVLETKITDVEGNTKPAYLIPSTERYNKIALAAGLGDHFVISKVFRGLESYGPNHNAEFTMLEWYELEHDYSDLMQTVESLLIFLNRYINRKMHKPINSKLIYQENVISLKAPFPRINVAAALKQYCDIDLASIQSLEDFQKKALSKHYKNARDFDWQSLFELIFANEIEPRLPQGSPCFIYDYPKQLCPLTKINVENPLVAEKVELYIAGKEIGNGYTEQTNWQEQEQRFQEEEKARRQLHKPHIAFDHEMIAAMKLGIPAVAGMGIGIDRLAMIYSDSISLSQVSLSS